MSAIFLGTTERFVTAHRFHGKRGFDRVFEGEPRSTFPRMALDTRFDRPRIP